MTPAALTPDQVNALLDSAGRGARVYLIAAGGCGMSGLGHLLLDAGFVVHGSDLVENEEVRQLRDRGAVIHRGHAAAQIRAADPALVVYSSAIRSDNPEVIAARDLKLPIVRRAVLLAAFVGRQQGICVAGMHGKTTTTAMLAFALQKLDAQPSYAVGALVPQLKAHAHFSRAGEDALFVAEADESDGTLREFKPAHAIILNVDEEHLDYFVNVQNVCHEFEEFATNATRTVVFCADDHRLAEMMARHPRAVSFGYHSLSQYRIDSVTEVAGGNQKFSVWHKGSVLGQFEIRLVGPKNVSNACAAIALLHQLGFAAERIAGALCGFTGAARRQQLLYADRAVRVYDDYGHHPSEIRATLAALRKVAAPGRLVTVFQPHRYTRTLHLMEQFAEAFGDADHFILTDVYAASEPVIEGADSRALAAACARKQRSVEYIPALKEIPPAVVQQSRPGDLMLFIGAGDITKAAHACADLFRERGANGSISMAQSLHEALRAVVTAATVIHRDEPLSRRTTMRVGGKADFYVEPASEQDLSALLRLANERGLPFTIIGRGSNLLIRDGGIRGLVICLAHECFSRVQVTGEHLHCGAGAKLKTVSVEARRAGLAGLEFLEGIPGSVGGALRMNAGAMGSWMFEVVEHIRFMDFAGEAHERKASEVNVEYRGCPLFKTHIALGAVLRGTPASKEQIQERANRFNAKRWESQPAQPSAGCIFKNPKSIPAGKLIDELGLKGTRRGGAMVSTVHGNFIVNEDNATARDVLELIEFIKQTAKKQRNIVLETEVEILGE